MTSANGSKSVATQSTIGKNSIPIAQADGTVVVASIRVGEYQGVLIVSKAGQVTKGRATIEFGVANGQAYFLVSKVKASNQ